MQLLYATHFQIQPQVDETAPAAFDRIAQQVRAWIIDWYTRNGHHATIPPGNQFIQLLPGHSLAVRTQGPLNDGTVQTRFVWIHTDSRDDEIHWHITTTISMSNNFIELSLTVSRAADSFRPPPRHLILGRPRIIKDLLVGELCSIGGLPVGIEPTAIAEASVAAFVENNLCSADRTLPVLVVSPSANGSFYADANDLADRMAGLCTIVALKTHSATFTLTDLIGRELSCFKGAARLYWPGFSKTANPWRHPLFMPDAIKRFSETRSGFHGELISTISAALSLRYLPGPVTRLASMAFAKSRRDEIDDAKNRYEKGLADQKEFEGVLKLVEEERDTFKEELEKAKNRAELLLNSLEERTQELEEMKKNWRVFERYDQAETVLLEPQPNDEESIFSTVEDAVLVASDEFQPNLEFLNTAFETAAECPYKNPAQVFKVLQAINHVADSWKKSIAEKTSMGGGLVEAFKLRGLDFKKEISQTCRNKFEKDYTFTYNGEKHLFEQHITEGAGSPNSCFSVHMLFDKTARKVIIAHVGKHLPNTST